MSVYLGSELQLGSIDSEEKPKKCYRLEGEIKGSLWGKRREQLHELEKKFSSGC